jgi:hypothetical protein
MSTFDTVRWDLAVHPWGVNVPAGWAERTGTSSTIESGKDQRLNHYKMLQHEQSGLRVGGDAYSARWLEVSLPRLLHGSNGYLLRPDQIPEAITRVQALLAQVAPNASLVELTRADLVVNLFVDRVASIAALRGVRHPRVRGYPKEYFETGLDWVGTRVVVRFYDKGAEMNSAPSDYMRLEFQLRAKALAKAPCLWDGKTLIAENARTHYRELALGFEPKPVANPSSLLHFLALLHREQVQVLGQSAVEVYLATGKNEKYRRRVRAQIQGIEVPDFILYLPELLPIDAWPTFHDCLPLEAAELVA